MRSLLAVIAAVILGLMVARWIEAAGLALSGARYGMLHQSALIAGWGVGAYIAGLSAVMIGQRWRPLGFLAAAALGLNGMLTLIGEPLSIWTWILATLFVAGGGWLSVITQQTTMIHPNMREDEGQSKGLFS